MTTTAQLLGSAPLNASGEATFVTGGLPVGSDSLTAVYSGDNNQFLGSTSTAVTENVSSAVNPAVNVGMVTTPSSQTNGFDPGLLTNVNGTLMFVSTVSNDPNGDLELYKSNGTAATTQPVAPLDVSTVDSPSDRVAVGSTLFFVGVNGSDSQLWKSDGTQNGTVQVDGLISPRDLASLNGALYFFANGGAQAGWQLWYSDGFNPGTGPLTAFDPTDGGFTTSVIATLNYSLYFLNGAQLWKSDGANDTALVTTLPGWCDGSSLTALNGALYFTLPDQTGYQLWKSDGTAGGTHLVTEITDGGNSFSLEDYTSVGNTLYFILSDANGYQLWKSDGTAGGTSQVISLSQGISDLTDLNGTLYFASNDGSTGSQLWQSNGTAEGTVRLTTINKLTGSLGDRPRISRYSPLGVLSSLYCFLLRPLNLPPRRTGAARF